MWRFRVKLVAVCCVGFMAGGVVGAALSLHSEAFIFVTTAVVVALLFAIFALLAY